MERPVRLLMPATIIHSKGQHTAIRALSRLVRAGHDAVLWLAGDLTSQTQPYADHCNELAKGLGVAQRVVWLGLRTDMMQLMKACTIVVLPSYSEGHPRVTVEAGALGKPFVGTPVGGVTDMILPRITGMLHEIDDDEGMARCIMELLENPALCDRISQNARAYIRECFTVPQQMTQILTVLQKVAVGKK
jgi:glycosyltransferase involved in cell wall biosynthesis